jgi:glucose/arabinose dehydrogenase
VIDQLELIRTSDIQLAAERPQRAIGTSLDGDFKMFAFGKILAIPLAAFLASTAFTAPAFTAEIKVGKAAFGDWKDDKPGIRRHIRASDLPPPKLTKDVVANFPGEAKRPADAKPQVPEGFTVDMVATGIESPRAIRFAPNGDLFVADSSANQVRVYRIGADSAKPEKDEIFATGLYQPYGIAFYPLGPDPKWIYIANSNSVVRFPYKNGDLKAAGKPEEIIGHIPATHHWTRDLAFSPKGDKLYVAVGSGSNVALDMFMQPFEGLEEWNKTHPLGAAWDTEERRADVLAVDPDGKNEKIFATGLRNCAGMTINPATGAPWCVVNERDELGDNVPFEYATEVKEGKFYGWPWYYIGNHEDPRQKGKRPDLASKVTIPDVLFQAHSAPLGIAFYTGDDFPDEYKGDAFVTFHGSWNRGSRTGYKVVRVLFKDGKPTGEYEDFMTGFVISDKEVWGRPVGVAVSKDGSLFISDDGSGSIWRVTHGPKD